MSQPEGYVANGNEHFVCKLQISLYGLKQSARAWNTKMNKIFLRMVLLKVKQISVYTPSLNMESG